MSAIILFEDEEEWKDVIGYEGLYQVSSFGNIKSLDRIIIDKKNAICCAISGACIYSNN